MLGTAITASVAWAVAHAIRRLGVAVVTRCFTNGHASSIWAFGKPRTHGGQTRTVGSSVWPHAGIGVPQLPPPSPRRARVGIRGGEHERWLSQARWACRIEGVRWCSVGRSLPWRVPWYSRLPGSRDRSPPFGLGPTGQAVGIGLGTEGRVSQGYVDLYNREGRYPGASHWGCWGGPPYGGPPLARTSSPNTAEAAAATCVSTSVCLGESGIPPARPHILVWGGGPILSGCCGRSICAPPRTCSPASLPLQSCPAGLRWVDILFRISLSASFMGWPVQ